MNASDLNLAFFAGEGGGGGGSGLGRSAVFHGDVDRNEEAQVLPTIGSGWDTRPKLPFVGACLQLRFRVCYPNP